MINQDDKSEIDDDAAEKDAAACGDSVNDDVALEKDVAAGDDSVNDEGAAGKDVAVGHSCGDSVNTDGSVEKYEAASDDSGNNNGGGGKDDSVKDDGIATEHEELTHLPTWHGTLTDSERTSILNFCEYCFSCATYYF